MTVVLMNIRPIRGSGAMEEKCRGFLIKVDLNNFLVAIFLPSV